MDPPIIPDHFGNIMLTTTFQLPHYFNALQRILLTANGNLQLIFSSYHNSPVTITVLKNNYTADLYYDRCVTLNCKGKLLCTATSKVWTLSKEAKVAVESEKIGIGQLFRFLNILPVFQMIDCGLKENEVMWRSYILSSIHLKCEIYEEFEFDCLL